MKTGLRVRSHLAGGVAVLLAAALVGCGGSNNEGSASGGASSPSTSGAASNSGGVQQSSKSGQSGGAKFRLITNGLSPFWDPMGKGLDDAAHKYDVTANWVGPPNSQVVEQKTLLSQAASEGMNGIGISAIEAGAMTPDIDAVVNKGIPVISFDSDAPRSKRLIYIGTDNFQSGQVAGNEMVRLLPHGGTVYGFVGNLTAENARDRRDGFLSAVKGHNITLASVLEDQKDQSLALQNVENVLQAHPNAIQGLLGLYSYNLPKIAKAVKDAHLRDKIKIVGFDAEPGTIDALQSGDVDATVVQKPYEFGYLSIEFLYLVHKDGADKALQEWNGLNPDYPLKDKKINTGVQVVTPQSISQFKAQLAKWGVKSS